MRKNCVFFLTRPRPQRAKPRKTKTDFFGLRPVLSYKTDGLRPHHWLTRGLFTVANLIVTYWQCYQATELRISDLLDHAWHEVAAGRAGNIYSGSVHVTTCSQQMRSRRNPVIYTAAELVRARFTMIRCI